mgnify:CR=1 FL=1
MSRTKRACGCYEVLGSLHSYPALPSIRNHRLTVSELGKTAAVALTRVCPFSTRRSMLALGRVGSRHISAPSRHMSKSAMSLWLPLHVMLLGPLAVLTSHMAMVRLSAVMTT